MTTFYDEITTACNDWYQGWIAMFNESDPEQGAIVLGSILCTNPITAVFGFALIMNHFSTDIKESFAPITESLKEWISDWKDIVNTDLDSYFNILKEISINAMAEANKNQFGSRPR